MVWRPDFDEAVSRCFRRTPIFPTEAALQGIHQIDHIAWLTTCEICAGFPSALREGEREPFHDTGLCHWIEDSRFRI